MLVVPSPVPSLCRACAELWPLALVRASSPFPQAQAEQGDLHDNSGLLNGEWMVTSFKRWLAAALNSRLAGSPVVAG